MMNSILFLVLSLTAFKASANPEIKFTNKELGAAFVLVRPELNTLEINGRTGVFTPAPALKFFGVASTQFEINFKGIPNLADVEFNHLVASTPTIRFDNGVLEIEIPLQDQTKAMTSRLGAISLKGVSLYVDLEWSEAADGTQELVAKSAGMRGQLAGTGLLKPNLILNAVRKILSNVMYKQVDQILSAGNLQDSIRKGLLDWAKFYTGTEYHSIAPSSIKIFSAPEQSGISFQVNP